MQADIWARLGLDEPTADLKVIKRAYAARLKQTRPDDDAEAYQALRQAYEWAQEWVRWEAQTPPSPQTAPAPAGEGDAPAPAGGGDVPAPAGGGEVPAAAGEAVLSPHERDDWVFTPESLVERTLAVWRGEGAEALLAHWPSLRAGLEALPLSALPEASARLAEMVIHVHGLPDGFVLALDRHFGWREDFRTARLIGPQRTLALHAALEERFVRPITDAAVLEELAPLRDQARMQARGQRWRAGLHAALAGGVLQTLCDALPARQWRALGYDATVQARVRQALSRAMSARLSLAAAGVGGAAWLAKGSVVEAVVFTGVAAFLSLMAFFVAMWLTASLGRAFGLRAQPNATGERVRAWLAHPRRLPVGLAMLGASVVAGAWAGGPWAPFLPVLPWVPWFVLALLGTIALWPQDGRHGAIVVAGVAVGTALALGWMPPGRDWIGTPPAVALSLGALWSLLAGTAFERAWWGTRSGEGWLARPQVWLLAPVVNSLGLCERFGMRLALAPVALLGVGLALGWVRPAPGSIFIAWTLLVLAFAVGQTALLRLAQRLGAASPG
jgi:hypothetical protein